MPAQTTVPGLPSKAFQPFTPRPVETGYVAVPAGPAVYPATSSGDAGNDPCGPNYPQDPRNLSWTNIVRSRQASFVYECAGQAAFQINLPANQFYLPLPATEIEVDQLACDCAAAKAQAMGYPCATCSFGDVTLIGQNGFDLITQTGDQIIAQ